jgi:hypothetical protein
MHVSEDAPIEAFCSWFDVWFKGSSANPADVDVPLSTAPDPTGAWCCGHAEGAGSPSHSTLIPFPLPLPPSRFDSLGPADLLRGPADQCHHD